MVTLIAFSVPYILLAGWLTHLLVNRVFFAQKTLQPIPVTDPTLPIAQPVAPSKDNKISVFLVTTVTFYIVLRLLLNIPIIGFFITSTDAKNMFRALLGGGALVQKYYDNPWLLLISSATVSAFVVIFVARTTFLGQRKGQGSAGNQSKGYDVFFFSAFVVLAVLPMWPVYGAILASELHAVSLCPEILKEQCRDDVAVSKGDLSACRELGSGDCVISYAQSHPDSDVCNALDFMRTASSSNRQMYDYLRYMTTCLNITHAQNRCDSIFRSGPIPTYFLLRTPFENCIDDPRERSVYFIDVKNMSDQAVFDTLNRGVNVNVNIGSTLLINAVAYQQYSFNESSTSCTVVPSREKLIQKLVTDYHADVTQRDTYGHTALDLYRALVTNQLKNQKIDRTDCANPDFEALLSPKNE